MSCWSISLPRLSRVPLAFVIAYSFNVRWSNVCFLVLLTAHTVSEGSDPFFGSGQGKLLPWNEAQQPRMVPALLPGLCISQSVVCYLVLEKGEFLCRVLIAVLNFGRKGF